jgi:2,3-bisphosphoglycerate-dependent phosphoglycerate mutase
VGRGAPHELSSPMPDTKPRRSPNERRRQRWRIAVILGYAAIAFGTAWFFESQATTTVLFVRHADVDRPEALTEDPPLNATGRARADLLARFLETVDVVQGVDAVYAASTKRTQQTAEPVAERLGLKVETADPTDVAGFMERVLSEHKGQISLIVADADQIAPLIEELHGKKNIPRIGPDDYDELYIVTVPWGGGAKVKTLRLKYGLDWSPPAVTSTEPAGPQAAAGN